MSRDTLLQEYKITLQEEEKCKATIEKYIRDVKNFFRFLQGKEPTKFEVSTYKEWLQGQYKLSSVNSMITAVNRFLNFAGLSGAKVKLLKKQRAIFIPEKKDLSKKEYEKLLTVTHKNERLNLVMQTICSTGIRISELQFITVEAVRDGRAEVRCKNKSRTVLIPSTLRRLLKKYIKENRILKGIIFCTKNGKPLNRSNIWRDMKKLCAKSGVNATKVFPHNLRHLFAKTYYSMKKDIVRLSDILGHSSIDTTRLYVVSTGVEHQRQLSSMGLVFFGNSKMTT